MAKEKKVYSRRLSLDEARDGYILISKDTLSMFPLPGEPFAAELGEKNLEMKVDAVPCTCRGPDKPHSHYQLNFSRTVPDLKIKRGSIATVRKLESGYRIDLR
jgi:hypothetical protein